MGYNFVDAIGAADRGDHRRRTTRRFVFSKGRGPMFGIGTMELVVILVLALIIFGPGKLPEVGRAIGRSVREFKKATSEALEDEEEPSAPKQNVEQ